MSGWETIGCANHPDRLALERCEVCNKPVCAYCLYYTADGQRLCAEHADEARLRGIAVEDPAAYSGQLLGAQAGVVQKQKRPDEHNDGLYRGNSNDLLGLIALLIAVIALVSCGGGFYCLPPVGLILSLLAIVNAKRAYDPARTRRYGLIGLLVSTIWLLLAVACIMLFIAPLRMQRTVVTYPVIQPTALPVVQPTVVPTPTDSPDIPPNEDVMLSNPMPR